MSEKSKYELDKEARLGAEKMPEPSNEAIDRAAHILSEWLDDAAPLREGRYREPARSVLKFAAYLSTVSPLSDGDGWQGMETCPRDGRSVMVWIASTPMARAHCLAPVSICDDGSWWDDETGDEIEPITSAYLWAPIHPPKTSAPTPPTVNSGDGT